MTDPRIDLGNAYNPLLHLEAKLARQIHDDAEERDRLWHSYWEGRRMVTVPDNTIETQGATHDSGVIRLFTSFPNLAPKPENFAVTQITGNAPTSYGVTVGGNGWRSTVRDCIARLKSARAKDSTNRNLSTLLAVVVKVQKDLETLIGGDRTIDAWQRDDAAVESQVTHDDQGQI